MSDTQDDNNKLFWYRFKLLGLIGIFLSPFIAGWLALYVFDLRPSPGNYGTLVTPVRKLEWPALETRDGEQLVGGFGRKWTLVMFSGDACNEQCRSNLFYMRQLRTLLGRDTQRLHNVLISARPLDAEVSRLLGDYPRLKVIENNRDAALYELFELEGLDPVGDTPRLYLVDPDQNLMMYYPSEIEQDRVLEDIKKLMKVSQIG